MLISTGVLNAESLAGQVAIVTGGGDGIGYEAARALLWLGASVTIAELDEVSGTSAVARLRAEMAEPPVLYIHTDVADERSVTDAVQQTVSRFGAVDIVINNATVATAGRSVTETAAVDWDRSYAVNLRGPVLLARACLPSMEARRHGVFVCVSSTGGPYLGPYETMKAAQLTLAETLDAELDGSGVIAFTIGPGLVPTATAVAAVELVAPRLGLTLDQFYSMNRGALMTAEAAGAGFAAAVVLAERYAGQEISSMEALSDAGITVTEAPALPPGVGRVAEVDGGAPTAGPRASRAAFSLCESVRRTLSEQGAGWHERSFFERQWMVRDFRKRAGMPLESWIQALQRLSARLGATAEGTALTDAPPLLILAAYYAHTGDLARGYIKDPAVRDVQLALIGSWQAEVEKLHAELVAPRPSLPISESDR
jgi:NAD(P)-dependent dehydrogenase (short-subunit alcohol dehydrogenase family)